MATKQQQQVEKYFNPPSGCPGGCIAALTGMKDDAYDQMVLTALNGLNLKQKAMDKAGLDEEQLKEIPPIYFHGFHYADVTHGDKAQYKIGKDGRLRSSKYDATWLFFSSTQVHMYQYVLDMVSDGKKEVTEDFFYKDITSFSTNSETVEIGGKSKEISEFRLTVAGSHFDCSISGVADVDRTISAMKQKLREKKS